MRDVTALKQVKFTVFHNFGKTEIFHRLCTFPQMGTFSPNPHTPENTSGTCGNTCVQPKTLWNSHQELLWFVSCGPFSEVQLKKHIQLLMCMTRNKYCFLKEKGKQSKNMKFDQYKKF